MNVDWTQTRHFSRRICWVGTADAGRIYTLRLTAVTDRHALLELKRTDDGGCIADRRDGWATEVLLPASGLDGLKHDAVEWAIRVIFANP